MSVVDIKDGRELTPAAQILVIDDDPIIRMLAGNALRDAGHQVTEADSAEAAIELLDWLDGRYQFDPACLTD